MGGFLLGFIDLAGRKNGETHVKLEGALIGEQTCLFSATTMHGGIKGPKTLLHTVRNIEIDHSVKPVFAGNRGGGIWLSRQKNLCTVGVAEWRL